MREPDMYATSDEIERWAAARTRRATLESYAIMTVGTLVLGSAAAVYAIANFPAWREELHSAPPASQMGSPRFAIASLLTALLGAGATVAAARRRAWVFAAGFFVGGVAGSALVARDVYMWLLAHGMVA